MVDNYRNIKIYRATDNNNYKGHKHHKAKLAKNTTNALTIFHQNICNLSKKKEELLNSLIGHYPHIICLTEHHLYDEELESMSLNNYTLGAKFCRKTYKCGGVSIFIKDNLHFSNINIEQYSKEKDIEICALKILTPPCTTIVITVYRSPNGNITYFLDKLEIVMDKLYSNTTNIILCGDFNINYLNNNKNRQTLNSLLTSYSLYSVIDFPTRTNNSTTTSIDNVFINKFKNENYKAYSLINGLSDHDAQVLILPDTDTLDDRNDLHTYRKINEHLLNEFQMKLSYEPWGTVFNKNSRDTNIIFNNFLDTFLKTFNATFPKIKKPIKTQKLDNKNWITTGIKTSCNNKRKLYLLCRENNDPKLKKHYKEYCKVLTRVITLAKKLYYSAKLINSTNKPKTAWNIIKTITNNQNKLNKTIMMKLEGQLTTDSQTIAEELNTYFISAADNIINNNPPNNTIKDIKTKKDPLSYLHSAFLQSFTSIKFNNTTTGEINKIISELKNKNSCGYDEVTTKILKIASPFIVSPLTHICNSMLATGKYPDRLKYSEIKPMYKKETKL